MALTGKTIGQLDHLTSSLTGNEAFPIEYSGSTYHISQSQIVSGLAITGSNRFIGAQIITGSYGRLIYDGNAPGASPTLADIHAVDSYSWLERFYNDSFSQQDVVMAYFAWNDGRFVFHNESNQSIGLQVNGYNAENGLLVYPDKVAFVNNIEITGSIKAPSITGSLLGTASLALQVSTSISTQNQQHNVLFVDTSGPGYIQVDGGLRYNPNQDLLTTTASFALTASSADNFTVRGTLTATTIVAQTITASTEFITGSSRFGSLSTNTHQFTGSVSMTGSLVVSGSTTINGSTLLSSGSLELRASGLSDQTNSYIFLTPTNTGNSRNITFDQTNAKITVKNYSETLVLGMDVTLISDAYIQVVPRSSASTLGIILSGTRTAQFFNTGNLILQNGGTFTDNGYRLQISGSGAASGSLYVNGSSLLSGSLNVIGNTNITGSLLLSTGSMFGLPTTSSTTPVTGSMYFSGSLLFIYNGTRYMSASFV